MAGSASGRRATVAVVTAVVCLHVLAVGLSHFSSASLHDRPGAWLESATGFLMLSLAWRGVLPAWSRELGAVLAATALIPIVGHLLLGYSVGRSVWIGVGVLLQGAVVAVGYAALMRAAHPHPRRRPDPEPDLDCGDWWQQWHRAWAPEAPAHLVWLSLAGVAGALFASLWGTVPQLSLWQASAEEAWLWICNSSVTAFVGSSTVLGLAAPKRRDLRGYRWPLLLALTGLSCTWVVVVLKSASLPASWLVILPALAAGAALAPWPAAFFSLATAGVALFVANTHIYLRSWAGSVQAEALLELLTGVTVFLALGLSLMQRERVRLLGEILAKQNDAEHQAALLQTVMSGMSDGVLIASPRGEVIYRNPASESLLGIDVGLWEGSTWPPFLQAITSRGEVITDPAAIAKLWRDPDDAVRQLRVAGDGDAVRTLQLAIRSVTYAGERQFVLMLHDISEQLERESAMRGFAAVAAHDLRGPLTSLSGWVAMAREEVEPGSAASGMLERAHAGSERLATIIEDWLNYSVVRDGQLIEEAVSLSELVGEVAAAMGGPGNESGTVHNEVSPDDLVAGDLSLLRQALSNLIGNGLKYRRPEVAAVVKVRSQPQAPGWIRVDVSDNGIGLAPGDERRIFDMFHRSSSVVGGFDGSGIGLAVCREIVHRHGGRIWAVNNQGPGATFSFTVPRLSQPQSQAQ